MKANALLTVGLIAVVPCFGDGACVFAQTPYFQGKTIRLVQGREPGGSGDVRAKLASSYLKKYLPGNPNVVSEYMPGGVNGNKPLPQR